MTGEENAEIRKKVRAFIIDTNIDGFLDVGIVLEGDDPPPEIDERSIYIAQRDMYAIFNIDVNGDMEFVRMYSENEE